MAPQTQQTEFGLLGPLIVTRNGQSLEFAGARSKLLLALLALELLAGIAMVGGRPDEAEAHLREALGLACELLFPIEMAVQLAWLGDLELVVV